MTAHEGLPPWYATLEKRRPEFAARLEQLGETLRREGPLDEKTSHLVQLAGATSIRSEGSVHSHARRALVAGASREEIEHAVVLLTSTIGFPNVAAALSWINDLFEKPH
jgi:alkylhydroperoxidase/carboxymuconolactone decarboxylase family protein YurZ